MIGSSAKMLAKSEAVHPSRSKSGQKNTAIEKVKKRLALNSAQG
jgi:hypothetical protein